MLHLWGTRFLRGVSRRISPARQSTQLSPDTERTDFRGLTFDLRRFRTPRTTQRTRTRTRLGQDVLNFTLVCTVWPASLEAVETV